MTCPFFVTVQSNILISGYWNKLVAAVVCECLSQHPIMNSLRWKTCQQHFVTQNGKSKGEVNYCGHVLREAPAATCFGESWALYLFGGPYDHWFILTTIVVQTQSSSTCKEQITMRNLSKIRICLHCTDFARSKVTVKLGIQLPHGRLLAAFFYLSTRSGIAVVPNRSHASAVTYPCALCSARKCV